MTGLECLREEMAKRGCSKAQINSSTAAIVLDILSNAGNTNKYAWDAEQYAARIRAEAERDLRNAKAEAKELENIRHRVEKDLNDALEYIAEFNENLKKLETPEQRDAMRTAQAYVNLVNINTKYDNTAFIIGLAAILSRGNVGAIENLRRINPKLCNIDFDPYNQLVI